MDKLAREIVKEPITRKEMRSRSYINKLQRIIRDCHDHAIAECRKEFGSMFVRRMRNSARHHGRSLVGFCADVLVP